MSDALCACGKAGDAQRSSVQNNVPTRVCVWKGILHFKIAAWEAVSSQLGGRFATRVLRLAGKSLPVLGLLRSDIKMPFVWCHCALV